MSARGTDAMRVCGLGDGGIRVADDVKWRGHPFASPSFAAVLDTAGVREERNRNRRMR